MSQTHENSFDGFSIKIFQDEDGDWLAHFIELPNISAFADEALAALDELELAWTGVKESYRQHGEDIPRPAQVNLQRNLAHSISYCLQEIRGFISWLGNE